MNGKVEEEHEKTAKQENNKPSPQLWVPRSWKDTNTEFVRLSMMSEDHQDGPKDNYKIMNAVVENDVKTVRTLVENGAWKNDWSEVYEFLNKKKRCVNPMELACTLGYIDIIYIFLEHGCTPNLPTNAGRLMHTILESIKMDKISVKEGQILVRYLCQNGCILNILGENCKSVFLLATELGDSEILKTLLEHCVSNDILKRGDHFNGFTPLHMSCMKGDLDCVLLLLEHSSFEFVNKLAGLKRTPLQLALISMYKNLTYMNTLVKPSKEQGQSTSQLQKIRQLQYNSIAIIEALLLHGAEINSIPNDLDNKSTALCQAMVLVCKDETYEKHEGTHFSPTMQAVGSTKLQDLNQYLTGINSEKSNHLSTISPYAGLFRLLLLFGADPVMPKSEWILMFGRKDRTEVHDLIEEMFDFWDNRFHSQRQLKLTQLCKQAIRNTMARARTLHLIDRLPLPSTLLSFVKLQCL